MTRLKKQAIVAIFFTLALYTICEAQSPPPTANQIVQSIEQKNFDKASGELNERAAHFQSIQQFDSLAVMVELVGKLAFGKGGFESAQSKVAEYISEISRKTSSKKAGRLANFHAARFFESINRNEQAYKYATKAFEIAASDPATQSSILFSIKTNLGSYAQRLGNIDLSGKLHREAEKILYATDNPAPDDIYLSSYNMGAVMWYASKTDSASIYFQKALDAVSKMPETPENRYYRPAVLSNNLAAIYSMQGNTTQAINAQRSVISNLRSFLATPEPHPKKQSATYLQFQATDNLAGLYKELGDFKKAQELLLYSYNQKKLALPKDDPDLFKSQILVGQIHYALKDHDKARDLMLAALQAIEKADGSYILWKADALYTLALINDVQKQVSQARMYYEQADKLFEDALQGQYDYIYLDFLRNAALFFAEQKDRTAALTRANKAYRYILETEGEKSLSHFYQLLNLSEIHFELADYQQCRQYSMKSIEVVNAINAQGKNRLDSIKIEIRKPRAILHKVKSEYALLREKSTVTALTSFLQELNEAVQILERRKSIIQDPEDISLLMSDHDMLLQFIKKLNLNLYQLTNDPAYADQLVSVHESGIYNRIRSRLNKKEALRFAHVPQEVEQQELALRTRLRDALLVDDGGAGEIHTYLQAVDDWHKHMERLQSEYPKYYRMRYASLIKPVAEVRPMLPASSTVIRYLFVDTALYAYVTDRQKSQLVKLNALDIEREIVGVSDATIGIDSLSLHLHSLYRKLWSPLASLVTHKKVIIIPDGVLFNLNFELLTAEKLTSYSQLATHTLLARHPITYHYSLFLAPMGAAAQPYRENFVAFAPGFSDDVKNIYTEKVVDSSRLDRSYLSLLPQPFTISLAEKLRSMFNGNAYTNQYSTVDTFRKTAGNHRIIHIGTHAEANNISPEFSRLIFAKDGDDAENSLYLFDIYSCDLTSNLTVLTACESGKPGYQDGEGMISLAHAFNYAGSESIITGLWKIDEQVSARLMDLFYDKLKQGLDKDIALQQAKLEYLATYSGRTQAPAYWAGLVLIGDTAPVEISSEYKWYYFAAAAGALILLIVTVIYMRRKRKSI